MYQHLHTIEQVRNYSLERCLAKCEPSVLISHNPSPRVSSFSPFHNGHTYSGLGHSQMDAEISRVEDSLTPSHENIGARTDLVFQVGGGGLIRCLRVGF